MWFLFTVLLLLASLKIQLSSATDTLSPGQSLSGKQTLISKSGVFELGFFTPGDTSQNHYIGIWNNKGSVEKKRVVWVAKRDKPISDPTSSELKLVEDGNLVLFHQFKIPVWSSNSTSNALNSTLALLGDDGNMILVYRLNPSNVVWQTFDYPTDTWLPGQKLAMNKRTGLSSAFTSWKSLDDPSPGNYSLQIDQNGRPQYLITWNDRRYWVSGEWNGRVFSSVPEVGSFLLTNYVSDEKETYFTYYLNSSTFAVYVMDLSGQLRLNVWSEAKQLWSLLWALPRGQCNVYDYCGAFSSCNQDDSALCACFPGFQFSADRTKSAYECTRRIPLQCGNNSSRGEEDSDKFLKIPQTVLPLKQQSSIRGSPKACESACLSNCTCSAYAYDSQSGSFQCSTWYGDLLNVQPLSRGDIGAGDLYLRVAASETATSKDSGTDSDNRNKWWLWLSAALPVALTILTLSFILCWLWKRNHKQKGVSIKDFNRGHDDVTEVEKDGKKDIALPLLSFASVLAATVDLSIANKLGEGGFGPVYKGKLLNGQEVAVKRLSKSSGQELEELRNETQLIAKLQHRNLVRLLGCCIEDSTKQGDLDWGKGVHMKTRSCEESVSVSDSSMVYQNTQKPQGSDTVGGGGDGTNVLMDSTLQMMGFGLSTPLDWKQALLSRNSGRAENNFHSLLQEELSLRLNYTQENMMESSLVQKNWSPQNFSGSSGESSVAFKQINHGLSLDQNRSNTGNIGSDACTITCQGLPTDFSMETVPYNYQPTFLQGMLEPDLQLQQSPYQNRAMNYPSKANYGVNTNELSHSWQILPQYMKASPPTQHTSTNYQLHFSNNATYWNPAAASMSTRPRFLPSVQSQMFSQTLKEKPNCSTSVKPKDTEVRDSGSAVKKGSSEPRPKRPRAETPSPLPTFKVRKEKLGDRVTALQQLVSPFGKTDTTSVLFEAIEYIKFLHEQVIVLSAPYMKYGAPVQHHQNSDKTKGAERPQQDLRSCGLCLAPVSSIFQVPRETSADF